MNIVEMEIREMDGKFEQKNKGGGGGGGLLVQKKQDKVNKAKDTPIITFLRFSSCGDEVYCFLLPRCNSSSPSAPNLFSTSNQLNLPSLLWL